jgi:glycosyltransferase involved in cell wall biosynthesis
MAIVKHNNMITTKEGQPIVSVIIPSFNRKDKVLDAIKSVLDQDVDGAEIIIVDDGSTDGTFEYLESLSLPIKVIRQKNGGVSNARNTGIDAALGSYIAFLDSDDLWLPGKLKAQLEYFDKNPNIFVTYTDQYLNIDGKNLDKTRFQRDAPKNRMAFPAFVDYTPIHTSTVMLKREVFDKVGKFNEGLAVHEDVELWNRLSDHYEFGYIEKPLGVYRWESNVEHVTSNKNQDKFIENGRRYLDLYKRNKKRPLTPEDLEACNKSEEIIVGLEDKLNT